MASADVDESMVRACSCIIWVRPPSAGLVCCLPEPSTPTYVLILMHCLNLASPPSHHITLRVAKLGVVWCLLNPFLSSSVCCLSDLGARRQLVVGGPYLTQPLSPGTTTLSCTPFRHGNSVLSLTGYWQRSCQWCLCN